MDPIGGIMLRLQPHLMVHFATVHTILEWMYASTSRDSAKDLNLELHVPLWFKGTYAGKQIILAWKHLLY
jgi:hypothetical protein